MRKERLWDGYQVMTDEGLKRLGLLGTMRESRERDSRVWSVRLSTGLLGRLDCSSGNRGPGGEEEVMLVLGEEGLHMAVEMGFITCPSCRPEEDEGFQEAVREVVEEKYGLGMEEFLDKETLGFDARRVEWEKIGVVPGRMYLPEGLKESEIEVFVERLVEAGLRVPELGWYDRSAGGFGRYQTRMG